MIFDRKTVIVDQMVQNLEEDKDMRNFKSEEAQERDKEDKSYQEMKTGKESSLSFVRI